MGGASPSLTIHLPQATSCGSAAHHLPKAIKSITSFSEDKAHRRKQGAGIVFYVKPLSRSNDVFGKNRLDLTITLALKGCANSICPLLRVSMAYVDKQTLHIQAEVRKTEALQYAISQCFSNIHVEIIEE